MSPTASPIPVAIAAPGSHYLQTIIRATGFPTERRPPVAGSKLDLVLADPKAIGWAIAFLVETLSEWSRLSRSLDLPPDGEIDPAIDEALGNLAEDRFRRDLALFHVEEEATR